MLEVKNEIESRRISILLSYKVLCIGVYDVFCKKVNWTQDMENIFSFETFFELLVWVEMLTWISRTRAICTVNLHYRFSREEILSVYEFRFSSIYLDHFTRGGRGVHNDLIILSKEYSMVHNRLTPYEMTGEDLLYFLDNYLEKDLKSIRDGVAK